MTLSEEPGAPARGPQPAQAPGRPLRLASPPGLLAFRGRAAPQAVGNQLDQVRQPAYLVLLLVAPAPGPGPARPGVSGRLAVRVAVGRNETERVPNRVIPNNRRRSRFPRVRDRFGPRLIPLPLAASTGAI
jgi:hypothetical protein